MLSGDNGLLKRAGDARDDTIVGQEKEQVELAYVSAAVKKLGNSVIASELQDELDLSVGENKTTVSPNGDDTLNVNFTDTKHNYTVDGGTVSVKEPSITEKIKIGDYIDYDPTILDSTKSQNVESNKLTYTSPTGTGKSHGNGYTSNEPGGGQTFTATSSIKWRVLNVKEGKVEIIPSSLINTDSGNRFVLYGAIGYLYAEKELNEICKIYGYGYGADTSLSINYNVGGPLDTTSETISNTGARCIQIEDINELANLQTDEDFMSLNSTYGSTENPQTNFYYPTMSLDTGKSTSVGVKNLKNTNYQYNINLITNSSIKNVISLDGSYGAYWASSRCISTAKLYASYMVRYIDPNYTKNVSADTLANTNQYGITDSNVSTRSGIIPIVTLKSTNINYLDTSNNIGNIDNPWRLK